MIEKIRSLVDEGKIDLDILYVVSVSLYFVWLFLITLFLAVYSPFLSSICLLLLLTSIIIVVVGGGNLLHRFKMIFDINHKLHYNLYKIHSQIYSINDKLNNKDIIESLKTALLLKKEILEKEESAIQKQIDNRNIYKENNEALNLIKR